MKITINLSDAEVRGIKRYLKAVEANPNPKREDIAMEIEGIVHGNLQFGAVGDYVNEEEEIVQRLINKE